MDYGAVSEVGKVREENQDGYLAVKKCNLDIIAVADGMGGYKGGNKASSLAIENIEDYNFGEEELISEIREVINLANEEIMSEGKKKEYRGMGTTLTLGVIKDRILTIGHIGDSRAYLFRNKSLKQITQDHSYVGELLRSNLISPEEAQRHPKKNMLTKALGIDKEVEIDIIELELNSKDLILLCSDGLTNMIEDDNLSDILASKVDLQTKAEQLVLLANDKGGYDNITAVIYQSN
ncbi:Stp1/IreP family PP2C-type Ser/Thr phosphatase [Halonatronum saccharophilum]|uniref:Stp1/IreP family PP2C-type Ser/Thr phosphatase n=1 Tax=Halonatronum saccharophilum TaxID=150060 RepID=UPI00048720B2|nr:Stp1/IreP family PP2C-type Ser/Thr phosphatase [Halonatronum saccharophilum]